MRWTGFALAVVIATSASPVLAGEARGRLVRLSEPEPQTSEAHSSVRNAVLNPATNRLASLAIALALSSALIWAACSTLLRRAQPRAR